MSDEKKITEDEIKAFLGKKLRECENEIARQFNNSDCFFESVEKENA